MGFLFLTDASMKDLTIKRKNNSAFVGKKQFESFFGYTYFSRVQFGCGMFTDLRHIFNYYLYRTIRNSC